MKVQRQLPIKNYQPTEGFILKYQKLVKDVMLPYQYQVLCDKAEGVEKSHVIQNFINAGKVLHGEEPEDGFYGMVFQDSDAAKWLEAVSYALVLFPDEELEKTADSLIDLIAEAQDADGYLNTYYTIKDREKRWTNLLEGHELYCAGHMMEAAVAYYEATGKDKLLRVMEQNAEHIYRHFIVKEHEGYPGHPEIELALLKLYRVTGNRHCLELAQHFIDVRGVDPHFYEKEAKKREWTVWGNDAKDLEYQQCHAPVRQQKDAVGHSVRAVYLYTGMADLASETEDKELYEACKRLWESITERRMYVTGGVGSTVIGEAFTVDYDLPNDTAYAETCASVGLMCFASRMLENEIDGKYADTMERAFYNTVLAGVQLDGKRFFYVNPLEIIPDISGVAATHRHALPERPKWYACACCPPNVARIITSIGKYAYGVKGDTGYCHLYAAGKINFGNGMQIICSTKYPYDFTIHYEVIKGGKQLAVRIPDWSDSYQVQRDFGVYNSMKVVETEIKQGYIYLNELQTGEHIEITLDGTPNFLYSSSKVPANTGFIAVQRGPLVYCFEGVDNGDDILSLAIDTDSSLEIESYNPDLLDGTVRLKAKAFRQKETKGLYTRKRPKEVPCDAYAVPYYTWGNRGIGQMRVWMTRQ